MKLIPAKTPEFVKTIFPNFVWNVDTSNKELYLTFDDGPTPDITEWVLQLLDNFNAKATFFCIGNNVIKYPEIFHSIILKGHSIGNHTHNHLKGWKTKSLEYSSNIEIAQQTFNSEFENLKNNRLEKFTSDLNQKLFRPPYGKLKSKQAREIQNMGYKIVLWDVLSFDWNQNILEKVCLKNVISSAKEGSIIVFHDSLKAEKNLKYALPRVLEYYNNRGFEFKSIN